MKTKKIITVSLAAALAIGALTANGVLVSADAEKGTIKVAASRNTACRDSGRSKTNPRERRMGSGSYGI